MNPSDPMRAGRVGWCETGGKRRPVIILKVREDYAVVIYGTSTPGRDIPFECIDQKTVTGRTLQLTNPTYFYVTNVEAVRVSDIRVMGLCAPRIYLSIERKLVESALTASHRERRHSLVALTTAGKLEYRAPERSELERLKKR